MYKLYDSHHAKFEEIVSQKLETFGRCIIVDCHSFASEKLEYELCKEESRPDFCIGINGNEGMDVANRIIRRLKEEKKKVYENGLWVKKEYDIRINSPFSGSIKPLKYVNEKSVVSVMVEVNRYLYMDEVTGNKSGNFDNIKDILREAIINVDGRNDKRIKNGMKYLSTHYVSVMAGASMSTCLRGMGATEADFEKMKKKSPNFNKNLN